MTRGAAHAYGPCSWGIPTTRKLFKGRRFAWHSMVFAALDAPLAAFYGPSTTHPRSQEEGAQFGWFNPPVLRSPEAAPGPPSAPTHPQARCMFPAATPRPISTRACARDPTYTSRPSLSWMRVLEPIGDTCPSPGGFSRLRRVVRADDPDDQKLAGACLRRPLSSNPVHCCPRRQRGSEWNGPAYDPSDGSTPPRRRLRNLTGNPGLATPTGRTHSAHSTRSPSDPDGSTLLIRTAGRWSGNFIHPV